jgi:Transposase
MARELRRRGVTHVVMEASGVYTEPVYHALTELDFTEVIVVNPAHVKALKGHKTDARDCARMAELLECGLLHGSFIPSAEQKEVRDLTRYRMKTVQARTSEIQRLHKALETARDSQRPAGSPASPVAGLLATPGQACRTRQWAAAPVPPHRGPVRAPPGRRADARAASGARARRGTHRFENNVGKRAYAELLVPAEAVRLASGSRFPRLPDTGAPAEPDGAQVAAGLRPHPGRTRNDAPSLWRGQQRWSIVAVRQASTGAQILRLGPILTRK